MELSFVSPIIGDVAPPPGASRHLLPAGEKRLALTFAPSSPHRGEGGSRSEPGEGAYTTVAFTITAETAADAAAREALLDRAMGPGRKRKSSEKLRRGRKPSEGLAFAARAQDGRIVGTVRLWDVAVGSREIGSVGIPGLLLGPLAVDPSFKNAGIGVALMRHAIAEARRLGHRAILLVGDAPYYARFGFSAEKTGSLAMPGPYERHRLLALELDEGALDHACGVLANCKSAGQATSKNGNVSIKANSNPWIPVRPCY